MKQIKIIYWTSTILFAAFMAFTAIPDIMQSADADKYMTYLGYPKYFTPFIGVAKILGCIAILLPSFKKIKEWAYAGLFFDLIGALYSNAMVGGVNASLMFILLPMVVGAVSYIYNEKYFREKLKSLS